MESILCSVCGKDNSSRNYYCRYCGRILKEVNRSKKYGRRSNYLYDMESLSNCEEEPIRINGYTPYQSRMVVKDEEN